MRPLRTSPPVRLVGAAVIVVLALAGCGASGGEEQQAREIRIGTGPAAESRLLAAVAATLLLENALSAVVEEFATPAAARQALELGRVDLVPDYTGAVWLEEHGRADPPGDARTSWEEMRAADLPMGLVWLEPAFTGNGPDDAPADAGFAFVVRADAAIERMSQLAVRLGEDPEALVCVDAEFGERADGLRAVLDAYRVRYDREFVAADAQAAVLGVAVGDCIAGLTTATDGRAWEAGLVPLIDDLEVFPSFAVSLVVRDDARDDSPQLVAAVSPLVRQTSTAMLGRWNARIVMGEDLGQVARDVALELLFLEDRGTPTP